MRNSEEKKLVSVSKSLLDELFQIARRRGVSISRIIEDSIKYYIETTRVNYSHEEALEFLKVFKYMKALGGVFTPRSVLEVLNRNIGDKGRESLLSKWRDSGRAYGLYVKEKSPNPIHTLKYFIEFSRWDLTEISIYESGDSFKLRCVSFALTEEEIKELSEFIKGLLEGIGVEILKIEETRGLIIVEFKAYT